MNILHPIKSIEQWALQRLLKRIVEQIPALRNMAEDYVARLWEENKNEIEKKVTEAIKRTILEIINGAVKKYKISDIAKN